MSIESRWATWIWRWSVGQVAVGAVALVAAFVPAARVDDAVQWSVYGVVLAIGVTGVVLGIRGSFGGLATMPTGRVSDTEWNRLPPAERRRLGRALRRGAEIDPELRDLARWHAERSIRGTLPQTALQGALGMMWLGTSLLDAVGSGTWWFHVALGVVVLAFVGVLVWIVGRMWRSLARLEGAPAPSVG